MVMESEDVDLIAVRSGLIASNAFEDVDAVLGCWGEDIDFRVVHGQDGAFEPDFSILHFSPKISF